MNAPLGVVCMFNSEGRTEPFILIYVENGRELPEIPNKYKIVDVIPTMGGQILMCLSK